MDIYALDLKTGEPIGAADDYHDLEWRVRYTEDGSFSAVLPLTPERIATFQKGRVLWVDGVTYSIDQVESDDDDSFKILGNSIIPPRVCIPPPGQSHDTQLGVPAETAMKHYVNQNAGPGAASKRQVPNLVIALDQGRGSNVDMRVRYRDLDRTLVSIARAAELGWRFQMVDDSVVFDVWEGVDRSSDVILDVEFDTLAGLKFLSTILGRFTYAYVAGQGEGAARTFVERFHGASEPEGWERREAVVDARDLANVNSLAQRGDIKLAESHVEDAFDVDINMYGSFQYKRDWDIGDVVLLRNRLWAVSRPARVVGVVSKVASGAASVERSVELDRPWPTLKDKVEGAAEAPSGDIE